MTCKVFGDECSCQQVNKDDSARLANIIAQMIPVVETVQARWGDYHSMHEAYAITLEELDEVWDIVKQRQSERNLDDLRNELLDVAVCAVRSILTLDKGRGRI